MKSARGEGGPKACGRIKYTDHGGGVSRHAAGWEGVKNQPKNDDVIKEQSLINL